MPATVSNAVLILRQPAQRCVDSAGKASVMFPVFERNGPIKHDWLCLWTGDKAEALLQPTPAPPQSRHPPGHDADQFAPACQQAQQPLHSGRCAHLRHSRTPLAYTGAAKHNK